MFGQSDRDYFNSLWRRKLNNGSHSVDYVPGANLRIDAALKALTAGNRLLDIGCGNGVFLEMASGGFQEVYGIDIADAAIQVARQRNIQADVVNLNTDPIPYSNGFFDTITILSTLQYFYDVDRVLQECGRVLSSRGVLILSVPNIRAIWRIWRLLIGGSFTGVSLDEGNYDGGTLHYFAMKNVKTLLIRNGFNVVSATGIFCKPAFMSHFTDRNVIGVIKREFLSAEVFVQAIKGSVR